MIGLRLQGVQDGHPLGLEFEGGWGRRKYSQLVSTNKMHAKISILKNFAYGASITCTFQTKVLEVQFIGRYRNGQEFIVMVRKNSKFLFLQGSYFHL